jgi:anti-sigma factor RsiW
MDCRSVFERLSAELDGDLPATEAEGVRRHLLSCADCARKRLLLEQTQRAFRSIALEPVGAGVDARVRRRLRTEHRFLGWLTTAAGFAVALGFVLFRSPMRPPSVPDRAAASPAAFSASAFPAPDGPPEVIAGRAEVAADCGRSAAVRCRVETPCGHAQCAPVALVDLASFTSPDVAFHDTR